MPSPTTALKLIRSALGVTNAVGVDQALTAAEIADSLEILNDILEEWSTDKLSLWQSANSTFPLIPGQKKVLIGPTGDWVTDRPVDISTDCYTNLPVAGSTPVSYPCTPFTQEQYDMIAVKDQPNQYPFRYLFINSFPNAGMTFWPVPSTNADFTFQTYTVLTQIANAGTTITYPPGYAKTLKYVLAVELAAYFGKQASPDVKGVARQAYANLKRSNKRGAILTFDGMVQSRGLRGNRGGYLGGAY